MDFKNTHGIATGDGSLTLYDTNFGESFHSDMGALQEAEDLYVSQSGLIDRLSCQPSVTVLDVGLGLGYNAIAALAAWESLAQPCDLKIVSLEKQGQLPELLASCQGKWLQGWSEQWLGICQKLQDAFTNPDLPTVSWQHPTHSASVAWTLCLGDALEWVKHGLEYDIDIVFQDPFSPQKNPSMWSVEWFAGLRPRMKSDGILVTYSVSGQVRNHLNLARWEFEKIPTTSTKKHWLRGWTARQMPASGPRI